MKREKMEIKSEIWYYSLEFNEREHTLRALNLNIKCVVKEGQRRREAFTTLEISKSKLEKIIEQILSTKKVIDG